MPFKLKKIKLNFYKKIKCFQLIGLTLFCIVFLLACEDNKEEHILKSEKIVYESNPENAQIITSDIELFWKAYDKVMKDTLSIAFKEEYIEKGSPGVLSFIPNKRIVSAEALKELVLSERKYYDNIRSSSLKSLNYEKQIRSTYYALKHLYPKAEFPPLYFIIGRTTSGATATESGLVVGIEVFSDTLYKTTYGRPSLDLDLLPYIVAHEIIHFLQIDNDLDNSLLKKCIREGSADFISELTSGEKTKLMNGNDVYPYGNEHEEDLWNEFKIVMHTEEESPWLYSQTSDSRPQNLGYWIGYKIVKAYYDKALDKRKAIDDIINIKDYQAFFKSSEYGQKFE